MSSRLSTGRVRVRVPCGPLVSRSVVSTAACPVPTGRVRVQILADLLLGEARYANSAKRPGSNPGDCVGSTPTRVNERMRRPALERANPPVKRLPDGCGGSSPSRRTEEGSVRLSARPPRSQRGQRGSTPLRTIAEWTGAWFPARSHKPHDVGSNPTSATAGRVRKPAKRSGREPGDFVGSTPTSATRGDGPRRSAVKTGAAAAPIVARRLPTARPPNLVPSSNSKTPGSHPGDGGATPSGITWFSRRRQRRPAHAVSKRFGGASVVGRKAGFNSRADLCKQKWGRMFQGGRVCLASRLWWVRFPPSPNDKRPRSNPRPLSFGSLRNPHRVASRGS